MVTSSWTVMHGNVFCQNAGKSSYVLTWVKYINVSIGSLSPEMLSCFDAGQVFGFNATTNTFNCVLNLRDSDKILRCRKFALPYPSYRGTYAKIGKVCHNSLFIIANVSRCKRRSGRILDGRFG